LRARRTCWCKGEGVTPAAVLNAMIPVLHPASRIRRPSQFLPQAAQSVSVELGGGLFTSSSEFEQTPVLKSSSSLSPSRLRCGRRRSASQLQFSSGQRSVRCPSNSASAEVAARPSDGTSTMSILEASPRETLLGRKRRRPEPAFCVRNGPRAAQVLVLATVSDLAYKWYYQRKNRWSLNAFKVAGECGRIRETRERFFPRAPRVSQRRTSRWSASAGRWSARSSATRGGHTRA
jgi:hypothetical protein